MKKTHIFVSALCAVLSLSLVACGAAPSSTAPSASVAASSSAAASTSTSAVSGSESMMDGGASVVNPLVSVDSLEALNKEVGVKMGLPAGVKDATYNVLDKNIAQIDFTVDGVEYTLRGTLLTEDIAGVYGDMKDIGTISVVAGDMKTDVKVTSSAESGIYKWSWDKTNYTLVSNAPATDAKADAGMGKIANDSAVACA